MIGTRLPRLYFVNNVPECETLIHDGTFERSWILLVNL